MIQDLTAQLIEFHFEFKLVKLYKVDCQLESIKNTDDVKNPDALK